MINKSVQIRWYRQRNTSVHRTYTPYTSCPAVSELVQRPIAPLLLAGARNTCSWFVFVAASATKKPLSACQAMKSVIFFRAARIHLGWMKHASFSNPHFLALRSVNIQMGFCCLSAKLGAHGCCIFDLVTTSSSGLDGRVINNSLRLWN